MRVYWAAYNHLDAALNGTSNKKKRPYYYYYYYYYYYLLHTYIHTYIRKNLLEIFMGREVKTISLDATTAELAENIPNFSQWVRMQLLMNHVLEGGEPIHVVQAKGDRNFKLQIPVDRDGFGRPIMETYDTGRCNPHNKRGQCSVCWPPHLTLEEHVLEIAKLYQQGIVDPKIPLGGEEE